MRRATRFSVALLIGLWLSLPASAADMIGAQDFLDRFFGVNLHLDNCCNGSYADTDKVIEEINYIGATRLRDWASTKPGLLEKWRAVHRGTGAPFHVSIPMASPEAQRRALGIVEDWLAKAPEMIAVIEGGNEEDGPYARKLGATLEDSAALQAEVYALGRKAGVKVAQLSVGAGWKAPFYEGNYKNFGKPPADLGNAHIYMNPGEAPSIALRRIGKLAAWSVDGKPVDVTEFGTYRTPDLDPATASAYMHIAPFISYLEGQAGLSVYALHDDVSNALGFYDKKGAARPHADYWHVTARLLADPHGKNLPPKPDPVRLTGVQAVGKGSYGVKHAALYKADGALWVALFDEEKTGAPDGKATVDVGQPYPVLQLIDAQTGETVDTVHDAQTIAVPLPANHLFFVVAGKRETAAKE